MIGEALGIPIAPAPSGMCCSLSSASSHWDHGILKLDGIWSWAGLGGANREDDQFPGTLNEALTETGFSRSVAEASGCPLDDGSWLSGPGDSG